GDSGTDPVALREALTVNQALCRDKHALYEKILTHLSPAVVAYRTVETSFFGLFRFGTENRPLILLMLLGVTILATTCGYPLISAVAPRYPRDYKVQAWTMLGASAVSLWSAIKYYQISVDSGVAVENPHIHYGWMVMFAALTLLSAWQTVRPHRPHDAHHTGEGSWLHALQTVPLAGLMTLTSAHYFFGVDQIG